MKRTIALTIGALTLSAISVVGFGQAAQAAPCGYNFCLFEHDNFRGLSWQTITEGNCENVAANMNNKASSMANLSNDRVWFYNKRNCVGPDGYQARQRSEDKDLTNNGFDNKTSSIYS
ncbi:peptidase inhibitor family I36 protein [Nonomuraea sp. KM88]|uniref:peptidase inhibitor family I36 protein n=1 Tax=Nonomuraea sp. KM88 TaxID=3457427 RepID=UPI003FCE93AB